ncbi:MAG: T9SS type A sorting domain-containing protein [Bacteroidota bacterium]
MKNILYFLIMLLMIHSDVFCQEVWSVQRGGLSRSCLVDIPPQQDGEKGLPVIFVLHGYGGTASGIRNYTLMHSLGTIEGFITVYPQAYNNYWNSGIGDNPLFPTPAVDDVDFISSLIDSLFHRFHIDTLRVYSCGHSNGAFMSMKLARELSNRIAAIGSNGGVMTPSTASAYNGKRVMPVLLINGTEDRDVPYYGGQTGWYSVDSTLQYFIKNNGTQTIPDSLSIPDSVPSDLTTITRYYYSSVNNTSPLYLYKVIGGGHTWPGSSDRPSSGKTNRDIQANVEMWKMFRQFNLLGKVTNVANDNNSLQSFSLLQNYPNPFNPSTLIRYALPSSAHVKLTIHDILGREIATLVNEEQSAGWKEIQWNAQNFASGMYLVRMSANNFTQAKKILLMK